MLRKYALAQDSIRLTPKSTVTTSYPATSANDTHTEALQETTVADESIMITHYSSEMNLSIEFNSASEVGSERVSSSLMPPRPPLS